MLKLKTILQSNILYLVLFVALFLYCFINIIFNSNSKYDILDDTFYGQVIDYKYKDNKYTIILNGKEKLIVYYSGYLDIEYGDYLSIKGYLQIANNNTIPNNFNNKNYLKNKGINYILYANYIKIIKKGNLLYRIKNYINERINKIDYKGYIKAFIMGKKDDIEYYTSYQSIGVSHLFAISGMHIGLFSLIILRLFKKYKYKYIVLDIFLLFYGFIAFYTSSVSRCIVFIILKQLDEYFKFNISNIKLLFLTAFILILINYLVIFDISFIYSFTCVFGLLYCSKSFNNFIIDTIYTSFIAFIFSLPISLYYFHTINILSIFYNIIYIPYVSMIVYPLSLLSLFIGYSKVLVPFINILEFVTSICIFIKFLIINIGFSIYQVLIYYFLLFIILKKDYKYFLLLFIYVLIIKYLYIIDPFYHIYFFDVKQGDSALILYPFNKGSILIDTGGIRNYSVADNLIDFLYSMGRNNIDYMVLTHGDYDHMGEAVNLVNNIKIEKVIFNCGEFNDLENELIKGLDKKKIKYYSCIKELNIDKNKLYFLQTKEYDNENDNSNVIYTELGGYKFMFMGDASSTTEKEILSKYNLYDVDVLKVGHHGSKTSSSKEFVNEIKPKYSIISVGKNNRYGHPNKEVIDNLKESDIYRTDVDGSIMFKIKNNKLKIETYSP